VKKASSIRPCRWYRKRLKQFQPEAWDASKEAGTKVADAAEETCEKVKHAVTSDSGTGVIVEDRSVE
jgi:hypothetical protein